MSGEQQSLCRKANQFKAEQILRFALLSASKGSYPLSFFTPPTTQTRTAPPQQLYRASMRETTHHHNALASLKSHLLRTCPRARSKFFSASTPLDSSLAPAIAQLKAPQAQVAPLSPPNTKVSLCLWPSCPRAPSRCGEIAKRGGINQS